MVALGQLNPSTKCQGAKLVGINTFPYYSLLLRYNGDPPYGLRGYMNDRVNRIIGYAVIRQIREVPGTCRSPILMRDYVDSCTGDLLVSKPLYIQTVGLLQ